MCAAADSPPEAARCKHHASSDPSGTRPPAATLGCSGGAGGAARAGRGPSRRRCAIMHTTRGRIDARYILANIKAPARELGLALGRTSYAVYRRRHMLRRWLETEAGKAMRRGRRGETV